MPRARHTDPDTSHAAARSVGNLSENQRAVMQCIRMMVEHEPPLDEEIIKYYETNRRALGWPQQSPSGIRTRRAELWDAGKIEEAGKSKMTTGRMGRTWRLAK